MPLQPTAFATARDFGKYGDTQQMSGEYQYCVSSPQPTWRPVTAAMTTRIESLIDQLVADRPLRLVFVFPTQTASWRPWTLRARSSAAQNVDWLLTRAHAATRQSANPEVLAYLNRVSDLLYVLARHAAGDQKNRSAAAVATKSHNQIHRSEV